MDSYIPVPGTTLHTPVPGYHGTKYLVVCIVLIYGTWYLVPGTLSIPGKLRSFLRWFQQQNNA